MAAQTYRTGAPGEQGEVVEVVFVDDTIYSRGIGPFDRRLIQDRMSHFKETAP